MPSNSDYWGVLINFIVSAIYSLIYGLPIY